eukprot:292212_1
MIYLCLLTIITTLVQSVEQNMSIPRRIGDTRYSVPLKMVRLEPTGGAIIRMNVPTQQNKTIYLDKTMMDELLKLYTFINQVGTEIPMSIRNNQMVVKVAGTEGSQRIIDMNSPAFRALVQKHFEFKLRQQDEREPSDGVEIINLGSQDSTVHGNIPEDQPHGIIVRLLVLIGCILTIVGIIRLFYNSRRPDMFTHQVGSIDVDIEKIKEEVINVS